MQVTWLYTGEDGRSHFEELDVPLHQSGFGLHSVDIASENTNFVEVPAGTTIPLHPAPRRQFVVYLSGVVEMECGDGTKRVMHAGGILLADDTTGEGHITRDLEGPRRCLFISLSPDLDPSIWRVQK